MLTISWILLGYLFMRYIWDISIDFLVSLANPLQRLLSQSRPHGFIVLPLQ